MSAVGEGLSMSKRKSSEDVSALGPPPKKGQMDKARELLRTIAFVYSDSMRIGRWSLLGPSGWGDLFGCGSFRHLTGGERGTECQWGVGLRILLL